MFLDQPTHSKIGASSYERWGKSLGGCPGSVRQSLGLAQVESSYAREGTEAHELAASILTSGKIEKADPEMLAAVMVYVEFVTCMPSTWGKIEQKFDLSEYHPGLYGTADAVLYDSTLKKLTVIDYKHGAGIPVEAKENPQLMYYALGALHELKLPAREIEIVVVQPRCFHPAGPVRTWTTDAFRLLDFVADLIEDAKATEDPNAPLNPGDHCRFCPALSVCPAIREKSLTAAKQAFSPSVSYDPLKLSETLQMLSQMESWIKGVREFAYREAQAGRVPPGFKLVPKRANRKWLKDCTAEKIGREFALKYPDCVDIKLKSPAQIEKLIDKGLKPHLENFVVQESSGMTLVSEKDGREGLSDSIRDVFDVIE